MFKFQTLFVEFIFRNWIIMLWISYISNLIFCIYSSKFEDYAFNFIDYLFEFRTLFEIKS